MDFSPYDGYFLDPSECVGRPCADVEDIPHRLFCPLLLAGGALIDTTPTTPQVTTPQSFVGEGRSGIPRPTTVVPH